MIAYLATKKQFVHDAQTSKIEDIMEAEVLNRLGHRVGQSEKMSWKNSLGTAMFNVMRSERIPDDAGVAVEYRVNNFKSRIDFMVSGKGESGSESLVIIELKQWEEVKFSDLNDHVLTYLGGGERDVRHPSYQARSYGSLLEMYNEYVYENAVTVKSCAYLHNCFTPKVVLDARFQELLDHSPVFLKGGDQQLIDLVASFIVEGSGTDLVQKIEKSPTRPSRQLAEAVGSMLQGNEEFVLIDDQKTVLEKIVTTAKRGQTGKKQVIIVNGGPGTGKSVVSINALARLTSERLNARYVTPNAAPRAVFEVKLKGALKAGQVQELFSGSGGYAGMKADTFEALIVDEAHRLKLRSQYAKGGENQIKEIINAARTSVFFIDEAQKVTWTDIGEVQAIENFAADVGAEVHHLELTSQFRCSGSDDYIAWLDDVLGVHRDQETYFAPNSYDFQIFDDPSRLHQAIREKNKASNKARVVAGYCWDWISKKETSKFDFDFPEFSYKSRWNFSSEMATWIIEPNSVEEIGCIYSSQGLEADYIGVIVGPDLMARNGQLITDPSANAKTDRTTFKGFKKELKENPEAAAAKADQIIRNTYRTLMTRGMKGCYLYFTDPETAEYFKSKLPLTESSK